MAHTNKIITSIFGRRSRSAVSEQTSDHDVAVADDGRFTKDASKKAMRDARRWAGKNVTVGGVGGRICVDSKSDNVTTSFERGTPLTIVAVDEKLYGRGLVAFRVRGTDKYLTVVPYGDDVRNETAEALARSTPLLSEHILEVVDYAVASANDSFEGRGFNYVPMSAREGPPGWLQAFELESHGSEYGIKSRFGTYWRSQHWTKTVSQSPHCLGDEQWYISECALSLLEQHQPGRRRRGERRGGRRRRLHAVQLPPGR